MFAPRPMATKSAHTKNYAGANIRLRRAHLIPPNRLSGMGHDATILKRHHRRLCRRFDWQSEPRFCRSTMQ